MTTIKESFRKSERLCSKKAIEALFETGKSFHCPPFLIIWSYAQTDIPFPAQIAISVPKKLFKLAVTRNLIKRRVRESYRKNKESLYIFLKNSNRKIVFTIVLRDSSIPDYNTVDNSVKQMIIRFKSIVADQAGC
jgi:ribonuclease P protein component